MAVTDQEYRLGMRQLAAAVSVVTAEAEGARNGLTATAVVSLSAEPPRIGVAVNRGASALPLLMQAGTFAVNVLRYDQAGIAGRFADSRVKGVARFEGADWTTLSTGAPVLAGAAATFDCRVDSTVEVGTHLLLIGAVEAVCTRENERPLLYLDGGWASLVRANAAQVDSYKRSVALCIEAIDRAATTPASAAERLDRFVADYAIVNIEQTVTTRDFLNHEPFITPEQLVELNAAKNEFDAKLKRLIEEGVASGEFHVQDPALTALAITGMVSWIHRWYRQEGRFAPQELGSRIARMVSEMVHATPRTPALKKTTPLESVHG
jgi:flavin reductase (DIM6/NTAB) family NADH-FMN oxidoreductase RutF